MVELVIPWGRTNSTNSPIQLSPMFKSIDPNDISTTELHGHMLSAIAPRPIAFASTIDEEGNVNLSPFSFFNCFGSNPPTLIFSPARRVRDNTTKHTLENVKKVPEVVINVVNFPIVEQMSLASTEYEEGVNEFVKAGLTESPSVKVKPPRVAESPVAFECVVENVIETGTEGGAGNLIICRVVMVHLQEKYLDENGNLDTTKLKLVGRMGASWYCKATDDALFEIPKPTRTKGIGVDQLPKSVQKSHIFTGNNLGRMGNLEKLPSSQVLEEASQSEEVQEALRLIGPQRIIALHWIAKKVLEGGDTEKALAISMLFDYDK